jgi:hypothetical protein
MGQTDNLRLSGLHPKNRRAKIRRGELSAHPVAGMPGSDLSHFARLYV